MDVQIFFNNYNVAIERSPGGAFPASFRPRSFVPTKILHSTMNKPYSLKINELIQSSQAGVYFFQLNSI